MFYRETLTHFEGQIYRNYFSRLNIFSIARSEKIVLMGDKSSANLWCWATKTRNTSTEKKCGLIPFFCLAYVWALISLLVFIRKHNCGISEKRRILTETPWGNRANKIDNEQEWQQERKPKWEPRTWKEKSWGPWWRMVGWGEGDHGKADQISRGATTAETRTDCVTLNCFLK